jgi:hypothetical protein
MPGSFLPRAGTNAYGGVLRISVNRSASHIMTNKRSVLTVLGLEIFLEQNLDRAKTRLLVVNF